MPRPVIERRLGAAPRPRFIKPSGIPVRDLEEVVLGFDEAEALRLADLEGLYQEAAARSMGISRQTFGRIVEIARRKVADSILNGKALRIEGGEVNLAEQGDVVMKIAVPSRDGLVDEHFGHCQEFLIYRVEKDGLVEERSVPSPEACGCKSGIAALLARSGVTHLVGGHMGEGAFRVLQGQGIKVIRGASGPAKAAAESFAAGRFSDSGDGCVGHGEAGHDCAH